MTVIAKDYIKEAFDLLNTSGLEYLLMWNIDGELPESLPEGKDVDILIRKEQETELVGFLEAHDYEEIAHPFRDDVFLYSVDKFRKMRHRKNNVLLDLNFQLTCRSLNAGEWIPLDQTIQESAWENKRFQEETGFSRWTLGVEDEYVTLLARAVFTKRIFDEGYRASIDRLRNKVDERDVLQKLEKVFFKFAPYLIAQVRKGEYDTIVKNYIQFREY